MTACPECGKYVDEDEDECPNCGYQIRSLEAQMRETDLANFDPETGPQDPEDKETSDLDDSDELDEEDLIE